MCCANSATESLRLMSSSDIFITLKRIDRQDYQYFRTLSEADRAKLGHYMLLKWMSNTDDATKLMVLNLSANRVLFQLSQYPELCYHMLTACASGKEEFYKYRKKKPKSTKRPITVSMLKEFYSISTNTAIDDSELMDVDSIVVIANELGRWDEIKKLKSEY